MDLNKRIAYITASADTQYERGIIKTMSEQAHLLGYDIIVLTHFVNYSDGGSYIRGDENIYTMIEPLPFDGAIMNYSSYYSKGLADRIETMLSEKNIPVIAFDYKSHLFEGSIQQDREAFREMTEHFIKEHGCTRIYCLSGPKDDIHSAERIDGYKDALRTNGIPVRLKNIFYGDFWIYSPQKLAESILTGKIEKPQAIVCGNDYMALQLCISLSKGGISIPDDILVGGFDDNPDVRKYHPSVTTYYGSNHENAVNAVCRIHEMISKKKKYKRLTPTKGIRTGSSCGCRINASQEAENDQKTFDNSLIGNIYLHSSYSSIMNKVTSLEECSIALSQNSYLIDNNSELFFCLCTDWDGSFEDLDNYRSEGYSDEMICIFSCKGNESNCTFRRFPLEELVPDTGDENTPMTYIFTPLHYLERCCGYCVRRYRDDIVLEEYFGEFSQIASNALEKVRMLRYQEYLNDRIQKLSERDMLTGLYSRTGLDARLSETVEDDQYYILLYYIGHDNDDSDISELAVAFSQAVHLSCSNGFTAARTASDQFIIIGMSDGSDHPEQLFVNTLNVNLRNIEKQQNISILKSLTHFVSSTVNGNDLHGMIAELEEKLESYRRSGSEKKSAYFSTILRLRYSLYEEPQLDWNSSTESQGLGLSQSYFQHLYKQFTGAGFNEDVISARMALAERMLINTSLNVNEIAERCGYSDASYFMKQFRRKNGCTAREYAKRHSK